MRIGSVKYYNSQKKFGFMRTEQGDVFFHLNSGRKVFINDSDEVADRAFRRGEQICEPQIGNILCYEEEPCRQGLRAYSWFYKDSFDEAVQFVDNLPIYRVKRTYSGAIISDPEEYSVIWEGKNIKNLSKEYPKGNHRNDRLASGINCNDEFTIWIDFERSNDGGLTWDRCEDPRH